MNKTERAARAKARQAAAERAKTAAALKKRDESKAGKEKQGKSARSETVVTTLVEPMAHDLPQKPTGALALIVGQGPLSLRQANQQVWAYVQRNGFQDREQPHMIRIKEARKDEPLKAIVGGESISMFELTEKLRKHLR